MKHSSFTTMLLSALVIANAARADAYVCQPYGNCDAGHNLPGEPVCQQEYLDQLWKRLDFDSDGLRSGFSCRDRLRFNAPSAQTFNPVRLLADTTVSQADNAGRYTDDAYSLVDSGQDGFSPIGSYTINSRMGVRFGVFDLYGSAASGGLEPRLANNVFIRWQGQDLGSTGLHASFGVEQLITRHGIGPRPLWSASIGFKHNSLDVSIESKYLDRAMLATAGEMLDQVVELTVRSGERWSAYLEWVRSSALHSTSQRLGTNYAFRPFLGLSAEISKEPSAPAGNGRSMDVQLTFGF